MHCFNSIMLTNENLCLRYDRKAQDEDERDHSSTGFLQPRRSRLNNTLGWYMKCHFLFLSLSFAHIIYYQSYTSITAINECASPLDGFNTFIG